jgi:uncharacterized delta-60 repeat protein
VSLLALHSVTLTVKVKGATSPAALSVADLPLGVAASFDPPTSDTTSVLTLTASNAPAPGTTSILLHASGLEFDAITRVSLSVSTPDSGASGDAGSSSKDATATKDAAPTQDASDAGAGFSIIAVPAALSIAQGLSAPASVNVVRRGSFTDEVDVSFPSLPAGVTVTPPTLTIPAGATSGTVTVALAPSTPVGDASIEVQGTSGSLTSEGTIALTVPQPMGGVDTAFGSAGTGSSVVTVTYNGLEFQPNAAALQSSGAIVVAGTFATSIFDPFGTSTGALVRLTSNGALDTTFGGGAGYVLSPVSGSNVLQQLVVQSDDAVVATYGGGVVRFLANGEVDTSFGSNGIAAIANQQVLALAIDSNGRFLVAGSSSSNGDFVAERLTAAGALDTTFGTSGSTSSGKATEPVAIAETPAGLVFVAQVEVNNLYVLELLRLTSAGALDTTFGTGGFSQPLGTQVSSSGSRLVVDSIGRLVLPFTQNDLEGVIRVDATGALDTTFGTNGVATLPAPLNDLASIAVTSSGSFVLGGSGVPVQGQVDELAGRLLSTGAPDTTFNGSGYVFFAPDPSYQTANRSVLVLPNGELLLVGDVFLSTGGYSIAATRLYP